MLNYTVQFGNLTVQESVPDRLLSSDADAAFYAAQLGVAAPVDMLLQAFPKAAIDRSNGETKSWWGIPIPGAPEPVDIPTLQSKQKGVKGYTTPSAGAWQRGADGSVVLDASHGPVWVPTVAAPSTPPVNTGGPLPPIFGGPGTGAVTATDVLEFLKRFAKAAGVTVQWP